MPQRRSSLALLVVLSSACHRAAPPAPEPVAKAPPRAPIAKCSPRSALTRVAASGSSSSLALARLGDRRVALLADEDDATLRMIELAPQRGRVLASLPLGTAPGHVVIARDGRAIVSLPSGDAVVEVSAEESGELRPCSRRKTPRDPVALAVTDDDRTLLVVSRAGRALTLLDRTQKNDATTIALSRDPEGVLVDGSSAFVAHRTGSIVSVVSLAERVVAREVSFAWRDRVVLAAPGFGTVTVGDMPRFAVQAHALAKVGGRIMVPMVLAYPGDGRLHVTMGNGYGPVSVRGIDGYFPNEPALASLPTTGSAARIHLRNETVAERAQRSSAGRIAPSESPCLLPHAAAVAAGSVVVACAGIDRLLVIRDGDLARARRVPLPSGVMAVAADPDAREVIAWSQFARELSVVSLETGGAAAIAVAAERAVDAGWAEGRKTFHAPLGFDGRACASCHPDGLDDGLVWSSPHGPLQAPQLAGRLRESAPFGWLGKSSTLDEHLGQTMMRIGAKPMQAAAMAPLISYVRSMKSPPARPLDTRSKRGRELFTSSVVGCASCHYDDGRAGDGLVHDIGTGGSFDTPSLVGVASSGPYMHDGRFKTLREALVATSGAMGTTKQLSDADLSALLSYLETL